MRGLVEIYSATIRKPLMQLSLAIWPENWSRPPHWVYDFVVVWSSAYLGYRMSTTFDRGRTVFAGLQDQALTFLMGPLTILALLLGLFFCKQRAQDLVEEDYRDQLKRDKIAFGPEHSRLMNKRDRGEATDDIDWAKVQSESDADMVSTRAHPKYREAVVKWTRGYRNDLLRAAFFMVSPYVLFLLILFINFQMQKLQ